MVVGTEGGAGAGGGGAEKWRTRNQPKIIPELMETNKWRLREKGRARGKESGGRDVIIF